MIAYQNTSDSDLFYAKSKYRWTNQNNIFKWTESNEPPPNSFRPPPQSFLSFLPRPAADAY